MDRRLPPKERGQLGRGTDLGAKDNFSSLPSLHPSLRSSLPPSLRSSLPPSLPLYKAGGSTVGEITREGRPDRGWVQIEGLRGNSLEERGKHRRPEAAWPEGPVQGRERAGRKVGNRVIGHSISQLPNHALKLKMGASSAVSEVVAGDGGEAPGGEETPFAGGALGVSSREEPGLTLSLL